MDGHETNKRFFELWKQAIQIGVDTVGPRFENLFGPGTPESAKNKWDLRPDYTLCKTALNLTSPKEAAYIACIYSFFNAKQGQDLLQEGTGTTNVVQILIRLKPSQIQILADLAKAYPGWDGEEAPPSNPRLRHL